MIPSVRGVGVWWSEMQSEKPSGEKERPDVGGRTEAGLTVKANVSCQYRAE